jgi:hypothetical protein
MARRQNKLNPANWAPEAPPAPRRDICPISGKMMFVNETEATTEARHIREQRGRALDVYYCLHCSSWHFTSRSGR